ncbi:hypothetical protein DICVIV_12649 [Dictyocaulus viviparus]|uniref:Uncharacterized protein n=1 Tax=Dictyocaulus viviparus TaxID=29172 RepID=A0A0D8X9Y3_DICVI|nr:hypothetical protein DICVIV_12649 [Dictyocaulus viviparus]
MSTTSIYTLLFSLAVISASRFRRGGGYVQPDVPPPVGPGFVPQSQHSQYSTGNAGYQHPNYNSYSLQPSSSFTGYGRFDGFEQPDHSYNQQSEIGYVQQYQYNIPALSNNGYYGYNDRFSGYYGKK